MAYKQLIRNLVPYLHRRKWHVIGGFVTLVLANYFQVRVAGVVGAASDAIKNGTGTRHGFVVFALFIVGFTSLLAVCRLLMRLWIVGASRDTEFDFRNDIFAKLQALPPAFYDRQRTGDLISKATNDVEAVRMVLGPGILQFSNSIILFPIAVYHMVAIDLWLTVATMLPLVMLPLIVNYFGNHVHLRFRKVQDHYSVISAMVQENLAGMRVVKAFGQEEAQKGQFADLNREFIHLNMRLAKMQAAFFPMLRMVAGLAVVLLLWVGGALVIRHRITIGQMIEFSLIQLMLFWPMMAFGWTVSLLQRGAASMERIREVLKQPDDPALGVPDGPAAEMADASVELRNLTFRYAADLEPALRGINVRVSSGGQLGIVGPTGSGKSTFAGLIAKLYPVARGQILVGGADINDIPARELRERLSFVFQETFLFSDTIANNIAFGAPDATPDSIRAAAEQSHIAREIEAFPQGYDTMLGERGINLSGGQKQRTAIARAIIRDPRILILDDALSAVDTETEERIIASLREVFRGRTAIIIAHRISAVMHCDEIIVLDNGAIIERGTHAGLLETGGLYADLYEKQLLADAVEMDAG